MELRAHTYRLTDGTTLVVRAGRDPWQTVTFAHMLFSDIEAASADEVAAVVDELDGVNGFVDEDGRLVLASEETGEYARIEVDLPASTAAAALGLTGSGTVSAHGAGPGAARLIGTAVEPFLLPENASMTVHVDGKARKVDFGEALTSGSASGAGLPAASVAEVINLRFRRMVARATGDGRIVLMSPTVGLGTRLSVSAPADPATPDAAEVLGFVGRSAHAEPYRSDAATLTCAAPSPTAVVTNLTGAPIELQLPTGRAVLPARGSLTVAGDLATDSLLLRLAAQGSARISGISRKGQ